MGSMSMSMTPTSATGMASMSGMSSMSGMGSMSGMSSMTATAAMSSGTGMAGMDHSGMGSSSCKISMLWNWNTIDACFISRSWHITSRGMFAGSCIGVICLVISLEFLRRVGREYDAYLLRRGHARLAMNSPTFASPTESVTASSSGDHHMPKDNAIASAAAQHNAGPLASPPIRPNLVEQLIRAALHMVQFGVAYFVMLLAMYYNGYIIICILIGAFLGAFIFSWEPLRAGQGPDVTQVTKCCG